MFYFYFVFNIQKILIIKILHFFLQFTQKGFRKRLIEWVIVNDHSFTVVEENEFKAMIKLLQPDVKIPSADTVHNDLTINFNKIKNNVRQQLQVSNFNNFNKF